MLLKKLVFAFVVLGVAVWASAQYQGRIEGRVLDDTGDPLDKAEVVIVSSKLETQKFELRTDEEGRFTQIGLMPGFYMINVRKTGFAPRAVEVKVSIAETSRFDITLERAASEAERTRSESDRHFLKGNELYSEKKFAEAASAYEKAIQLSQDQWAYHFNLGLAHKKMGHVEEATAAFRRASELNPNAFSVNKELAESLAKAGNYDEAKTLYRKAGGIDADDPDVFYNLGLCEVSTGESEAAMESFLRCLTLKPDYADAHYQLGTLYIGQNKTEEAVRSLEKFLELAPGHEKAGLARQLLDYLKKSSPGTGPKPIDRQAGAYFTSKSTVLVTVFWDTLSSKLITRL